LSFGVSGRLYKSNVLLYDHQTESLWSQLREEAVTGELAGTKLEKLASTRTTWRAWRERHPDTLVLSTETGYRRNYSVDPYTGYYRALGLMFPVGDVRKDLPAKEMVLGVELGGAAKAYPLEALKKNPGTLKDDIGDVSVAVEVSGDGEEVGVTGPGGKALAPIFAYWFAWQAFHPETEVYREPE